MRFISKLFLSIAVFVVASTMLHPVALLAANLGGAPAGKTNLGGAPATTATQPDTNGLTNPLNNINSLPDFLNKILEAVVQLGTIVLILAIVYVGFLFVVAQGNEEKIKSARSALFWTVIGGLVLLGAQTIGMVISSTVGAL